MAATVFEPAPDPFGENVAVLVVDVELMVKLLGEA